MFNKASNIYPRWMVSFGTTFNKRSNSSQVKVCHRQNEGNSEEKKEHRNIVILDKTYVISLV